MSLSDFIRRKTDLIVDESERFARTVVSLSTETDAVELRNHLPLVLRAIALDLEQPQSPLQQTRKSEGHGPTLPGETAAQIHGRMRARSGLSIQEVVSEYRALRATVLRLWDEEGGTAESGAMADLMRFNEAIDQAIAESVLVYSEKIDHWRRTLLAVIGHDLRNPLQALKMSAQALERVRDPSLEKHTNRLNSGIAHISRLLDVLLDYNKSKLGTGMQLHRRTVDVGDACRTEVDVLKAALPRARIGLDVSGDTTGSFDDVRIREALSNLVSNAHQYQQPNTDIAVRVEGQSDRVTICVSNVGPDIEPKLLARLFEPFQRNVADEYLPNKRNLGLGLFVVREIARGHNGDVTATSADGRVTFELQLPKLPSEPPDGSAAAASGAPLRAS